MRIFVLMILVMGLACSLALAVNLNEEFEDGLDNWVIVDEPANLLNDKGPSNWETAQGSFKGKALSQTSNIWGDPVISLLWEHL